MDSKPLLPLATLDEQTLLEFVQDIIEHLKGEKIAFLSKYYEQFGQSSRSIVPARDFLISLIELALRGTSSASTLDQFKTIV